MRTPSLLVAFVVAMSLLAPAEAARAAVRQSQAAAKSALPAKTLIDLNTATIAQLETLPGVGRRTAERIVEHRKKTPFTKIEQLMNVKGIGEKSFLRLKPLVTVTPSQPDAQAPPR